MQSPDYSKEVARGERFEFGENWRRFLSVLNDERIRVAEDSLKRNLGADTLAGRRFLDIGSGSGLFSLAARNLGANVVSFDYDASSVGCTTELKARYHPDDADWTILRGSVLDADFVASLGQFDIVYSWGVLHHTGEMWKAIDIAAGRVAPGGRFFIAIYNDQGGMSKRWLTIKKIYNRLPRPLRPVYTFLIYLPREMRSAVGTALQGKFWQNYVMARVNYSSRSTRGMSWWHDRIDWIGGLPFEVAKPEAIFDFCAERGFALQKLKTCAGGLGCNEYVFWRPAAD